jgi:hypothetical protein
MELGPRRRRRIGGGLATLKSRRSGDRPVAAGFSQRFPTDLTFEPASRAKEQTWQHDTEYVVVFEQGNTHFGGCVPDLPVA